MKIIIIDDDPIVADSLALILGQQTPPPGLDPVDVLALGHSGQEAIDLYKAHRPDLILLDIRMDGLDGLAAGQKILQFDPEAKILFLTTFLDDDYIVKALRLGAKGYLMKAKVEHILPALLAIQQGQRVYGDEIADKLPGLLQEGESSEKPVKAQPGGQSGKLVPWSHPKLNARECELVRLVAEGANNREIAAQLYLSEGTVRNYLSTILNKLELRDRTQLAIFYYKAL